MAFSLPTWKRRVLLPASSRYNLQDAHMAVAGVRNPCMLLHALDTGSASQPHSVAPSQHQTRAWQHSACA